MESHSDEQTCCPIVELRQYTLQPGARETLIELFEREFVETQEEVGMRIIGTFRDLEKPDRFVWLRGFEDMESRAKQLSEFYGGPVWKRHREAANATMIDSDNVLLLRPLEGGYGFRLAGLGRANFEGEKKEGNGLIIATIFHLKEHEDKSLESLGKRLTDLCEQREIDLLGAFVTAQYENTFPALPVREDANVVILFLGFADRVSFERDYPFHDLMTGAGGIRGEQEVLLLAPTKRSLLRAL